MNAELDVRSSITTTTNVTSGYDATYGVEIMKAVDKKIVDILNNSTPIRAMITRKSMNGQLTYNWNIRPTNNTSSAFYSEGGAGTAATGTKVQLIAIAKSYRTDWEVTGLFQAATASYYDAIMDEMDNAIVAHRNLEEAQIITGTDSGGYGSTTGFLGIKQILDSYVTNGNTDTVFGIARASGKTYMDCQLVAGGSNALDLTEIDAAITAVKKKDGVPWMILCSPDKSDEINQLLQSQQRFMGTTQVAGGFTLATYQGIPIVSSIYMDRFGASDTDTAMLVLGSGIWEMRVLKETTNIMVANTRSDVTGGYLKTYEVLVCKDITKNCLMQALAV